VCVTAVILSNFSGHYLRNRSNLDMVFWVTSVYFNIRNTLPKFCSFLLGHPVYIYIYIYTYITRLASNEIFSPPNKIHWEGCRGKDLSAPLYMKVTMEYCWCDLDRKAERLTLKPVPVSLCPPQVLRIPNWERARASAVF